MAADPQGNRLATGGFDEKIQLWDFTGMDSNHNSFWNITPYQGYPVKEISYSPNGSHFLAVCGDRKVKIYTRDGVMVWETARGDVYMSDVNNTKGHIRETTAGKWHWTD